VVDRARFTIKLDKIYVKFIYRVVKKIDNPGGVEEYFFIFEVLLPD